MEKAKIGILMGEEEYQRNVFAAANALRQGYLDMFGSTTSEKVVG